jgi:hypothetical protein
MKLAGGGFSAVMANVPPEKLQVFGGPNVPWLERLDAWAVPICGSVVAQELIARVLASRSERVARRSPLFASGLYLTFGLIPVFIGPSPSNRSFRTCREHAWRAPWCWCSVRSPI